MHKNKTCLSKIFSPVDYGDETVLQCQCERNKISLIVVDDMLDSAYLHRVLFTVGTQLLLKV